MFRSNVSYDQLDNSGRYFELICVFHFERCVAIRADPAKWVVFTIVDEKIIFVTKHRLSSWIDETSNTVELRLLDFIRRGFQTLPPNHREKLTLTIRILRTGEGIFLNLALGCHNSIIISFLTAYRCRQDFSNVCMYGWSYFEIVSFLMRQCVYVPYMYVNMEKCTCAYYPNIMWILRSVNIVYLNV